MTDQIAKKDETDIQNRSQGVSRPQSFDDMKRIAQTFYKSGFFDDVQNVAQATVKMIAGDELGLGPMASMRSVHAFEGQTSLHYSIE